MMRLLIFIMCLYLGINYSHAQIDPVVDSILQRSDRLFDAIQTMEYSYHSEEKIREDITYSLGKGYIQKTEKSRIGYIYHLIRQPYQVKFIYDGEQLAIVNDKRKTSNIGDPDDRKSRLNHPEGLIPTVFKENYFSNFKNDSTVLSIKMVSDTLIQETPCYRIRVKLKSKNQYSTVGYDYFIQKNNYFCLGRESIGTWVGEAEHSNFIIDYADVNGELKKDLFLHYKNIPTKYRSLKSSPLQKRQKPLKKNKRIPKFKAYTLDSILINRDSLLGQITILDFWFVNCSPCIDIIPALDSISIKYKDQGVKVVGINPIDDIESIKKFKAFTKLSYESLIMDSDSPKKFNVKSYPAVYILDKEAKVVFSKRVGPDKLIEVFSAEIDALLKED